MHHRGSVLPDLHAGPEHPAVEAPRRPPRRRHVRFPREQEPDAYAAPHSPPEQTQQTPVRIEITHGKVDVPDGVPDHQPVQPAHRPDRIFRPAFKEPDRAGRHRSHEARVAQPQEKPVKGPVRSLPHARERTPEPCRVGPGDLEHIVPPRRLAPRAPEILIRDVHASEIGGPVVDQHQFPVVPERQQAFQDRMEPADNSPGRPHPVPERSRKLPGTPRIHEHHDPHAPLCSADQPAPELSAGSVIGDMVHFDRNAG